MIEGRALAASAGRASSWQMNGCPIAKPLIPIGATDQVRSLVLRSPALLWRGPTRIAITDQVNRIAPNAITSPRFAFAIAGAGRHLAGALQASSPNSVGRSFDRPFFMLSASTGLNRLHDIGILSRCIPALSSRKRISTAAGIFPRKQLRRKAKILGYWPKNRRPPDAEFDR